MSLQKSFVGQGNRSRTYEADWLDPEEEPICKEQEHREHLKTHLCSSPVCPCPENREKGAEENCDALRSPWSLQLLSSKGGKICAKVNWDCVAKQKDIRHKLRGIKGCHCTGRCKST